MRPAAEAIPEITRRLEQFQPERVILFGSQARGDARPTSDVDVLVLVSDATQISDIAGRMYEAMAGIGIPVDIVVMPLSEFERFKPFVGSIARPASREGRVLYERAR